ncbi:MAG: D-glycero-beta-D-manno-heptose 1-phosphate adenylyltransferase [Desulfobacterales bacterium]|nr:D-glycero-beta-D-manno-heptose 1-phosphate adenylyltransferase [Desulfobacterales bacterium]
MQYNNSKRIDIHSIHIVLNKHVNQKIVFTNGCFDILHAGHVQYLQEARALGDLLIIGLNSDISVRKIKGPKRPIIHQDQRAFVLSALSCVDYIVLFDEPDPFEVISCIQPNILVKGADWAEDKIIGGDVVKQHGGRIVRIDMTPDISTSLIIERILHVYETNQP